MEKIFRKLFSMEMMTLGLFIFLVAIARATFIESDYGTQASKAVIYNTWWFELLMVYSCINLIVNIFRHRMFAREKIAILFFHLSFIVIIIGAGLTRYVGFEGIMLIREGEQSNTIYSSDGYLQILAHDGKTQYEVNEPLLMAEIANNYFDFSFNIPDTKQKVKVEYLDFIPNAVSKLETGVEDGKTILEIVTPGPMGMDTNYVEEGTLLQKEGFILAFEYPEAPLGAVQINKSSNGFEMTAPSTVNYMLMSDQSSGDIPADSTVGFYQGRLYTMMGNNFVYKAVHEKAKLKKVKSYVKEEGLDVLYIKLSVGDEEKIVELEGGQGRIPVPVFFQFAGLNYKIAYGALPVYTPFFIALRDFQLDRYPGSDSPSSYASEVTVIDEANGVQFDKRIFMNSVMDYNGYRFFQSSYDPDEKGTRLSVNQDFWGTNVSYLGYLLMSIGMVMTIFSKASRFSDLNRKIKGIQKKKTTLYTLILLFSLGGSAMAQDTHDHDHSHHELNEHDEHDGHHNHTHDTVNTKSATIREFSDDEIDRIEKTPISTEHALLVESLIIQDYEGRFKPLHTVALEVLRKIHRKDTYNGLTPTQVFLDMHLSKEYWMQEPIIAVNNAAIREKLALNGKYASFNDFFDPITGAYLLEKNVAESNRKPAAKQTEWDKQIIKVNERLQVISMVFMYRYLRIFPIQNDENNSWFDPNTNLSTSTNNDSTVNISSIFYYYLYEIANAKLSGDYAGADEWLEHIKSYQRIVAEDIIPSENKIKAEIYYNKLDLFPRLSYVYLLLGFALLFIFFIRVFTTNSNWTKIPNTIFTILIVAAFVSHGAGLGMRWYISGHAPWSNGYEALVFISWITMLAGILFSKKSMVTLGATSILTFFMLFVAHMNQLDPEITNLVPVLQSYWLMIHVAIITGSYGFLGLGAIIAIINLMLFIFRTKDDKRVNLHIKEISYIIELTTTIGLFMLTIGTFLGGIWANESWGRYWGWDPKETWALVSILVYAILLHLRFIPALKSKLVFNSVAMWSYGAILFTFFGVNFFLVGLHSYAEGEADTMWPAWVVYTIIGFAIFNIIAIIRGVQTSKK